MATVREQYMAEPVITLPIVAQKLKAHPTALKPVHITSLSGACSKCGKPVVNPRGQVDEHTSYMLVEFAGVCPSCGQICKYKFRWYPQDQMMLQMTSNGWKKISLQKPFFTALVIWLWWKARRILFPF